jgi:DGQHR domain-containing protein
VNGAEIRRSPNEKRAATLVFSEEDSYLSFSVIDGQHRINGAFFALRILKEVEPTAHWEIPAEVFVDLDRRGDPPRRQAQIFIDVNFYQKKVDRSLVADLFPTARGGRTPIDDKERAQDLGRRLMLEIGPLVGMIQIPGVRYGVKDVVTLATLNGAIEEILPHLERAGIQGLDFQAEFLAQCLSAWLDATGRRQDVIPGGSLDPENVAYQGRVLVSFITLIPACIRVLQRGGTSLVSATAHSRLVTWLKKVMSRAGLLVGGRFLPKGRFKIKGFLGSGGVGRFRNTLWAATEASSPISRYSEQRIAALADAARSKVYSALSG